MRANQLSPLTLVAGISVARLLKGDYTVSVRLKWPNDIYLNDKKLGGILTELHTEGENVSHMVVGLGLNVNAVAADFSPEVASTATSLYLATEKTFSVKEMAGTWCHHLKRCYQDFVANGFEKMQREYEAIGL